MLHCCCSNHFWMVAHGNGLLQAVPPVLPCHWWVHLVSINHSKIEVFVQSHHLEKENGNQTQSDGSGHSTAHFVSRGFKSHCGALVKKKKSRRNSFLEKSKVFMSSNDETLVDLKPPVSRQGNQEFWWKLHSGVVVDMEPMTGCDECMNGVCHLLSMVHSCQDQGLVVFVVFLVVLGPLNSCLIIGA